MLKMKGRQRWIAVLGLVAAFCAVQPLHLARADEAQDRKELEDVYTKLNQLLKDKDFKAIFAYETDDFTHETADGKKKDRKTADAETEDNAKSLKSIESIEMKIDSFDEKDGDTELVTTQTFSGTITDPAGKDHKVESVNKARETWKKDGDAWKISYSKDLDSTLTVDGQKVPVK